MNAAGWACEEWCRSWEKPAFTAGVSPKDSGCHLIPLGEVGSRRRPWSTAAPEAREEPAMFHGDNVEAQTPWPATTSSHQWPGLQTPASLLDPSTTCGVPHRRGLQENSSRVGQSCPSPSDRPPRPRTLLWGSCKWRQPGRGRQPGLRRPLEEAGRLALTARTIYRACTPETEGSRDAGQQLVWPGAGGPGRLVWDTSLASQRTQHPEPVVGASKWKIPLCGFIKNHLQVSRADMPAGR